MKDSYRSYPPDHAREAAKRLPGARHEVYRYWVELYAAFEVDPDEAAQRAFQKALRAKLSGYPHWTGVWIPADPVGSAVGSASRAHIAEESDSDASSDEQSTLF